MRISCSSPWKLPAQLPAFADQICSDFVASAILLGRRLAPPHRCDYPRRHCQASRNKHRSRDRHQPPRTAGPSSTVSVTASSTARLAPLPQTGGSSIVPSTGSSPTAAQSHGSHPGRLQANHIAHMAHRKPLRWHPGPPSQKPKGGTVSEPEGASSPRGDIIPECWARSSRNGGRNHSGSWATSSGISTDDLAGRDEALEFGCSSGKVEHGRCGLPAAAAGLDLPNSFTRTSI